MRSRVDGISCIGTVLVGVMVAAGCADPSGLGDNSQPTDAAVRGLPHSNAELQSSSGFYPAEDEGYWYWDGEPPPQDASPATITWHQVLTFAPNGISLAKAIARVEFDGDEGKNHVDFRVEETPGNVLLDTDYDQEWGRDPGCFLVWLCRPGARELTATYETNRKCGVRLTTSAVHYARKGLPFGLSLSFIRFIDIDVSAHWGDALPAETPQYTDPGIACKAPEPKFRMFTDAQSSGSGGSLTISAGHSVRVYSTTTEWGSPPAYESDAQWLLDQGGIGTGGAPPTFVPEYGTHTVTLSIINSAGLQGEATATLDVRAPDEAGSCDDPITDVYETACDDGGTPHAYGVGATTTTGTRVCFVKDWFYWDTVESRYKFDHEDIIACWDEQ